MKLNFKNFFAAALLVSFIFNSSGPIFAAGRDDLTCLDISATYTDTGVGGCIEPGADIDWEFKIANEDGSPFQGDLLVFTSGVVLGQFGSARIFNPDSSGTISGADVVISGENATVYHGTPIVYRLFVDHVGVNNEIISCEYTLPDNICEESYPDPVECYQAQGDRCISIGLMDFCDISLGEYGSSAECEQNLLPKDDGDGDGDTNADFGAGDEVTKEVIDSLNPLIQQQDDPSKGLAEELSTPGGIISRFLGVFAFPIAGFILFIMLIWGGIEMMAGSATSKSIDAGKQRITTALLGFMLLFASFWIARILEMMFGIKIL